MLASRASHCPSLPPPSRSVINGGKTLPGTHRFGRSWCGEQAEGSQGWTGQEEIIAIVSTRAVRRISAHGRNPSVQRAAMCGLVGRGGGTGLAGGVEPVHGLVGNLHREES